MDSTFSSSFHEPPPSATQLAAEFVQRYVEMRADRRPRLRLDHIAIARRPERRVASPGTGGDDESGVEHADDEGTIYVSRSGRILPPLTSGPLRGHPATTTPLRIVIPAATSARRAVRPQPTASAGDVEPATAGPSNIGPSAGPRRSCHNCKHVNEYPKMTCAGIRNACRLVYCKGCMVKQYVFCAVSMTAQTKDVF